MKRLLSLFILLIFIPSLATSLPSGSFKYKGLSRPPNAVYTVKSKKQDNDSANSNGGYSTYQEPVQEQTYTEKPSTTSPSSQSGGGTYTDTSAPYNAGASKEDKFDWDAYYKEYYGNGASSSGDSGASGGSSDPSNIWGY